MTIGFLLMGSDLAKGWAAPAGWREGPAASNSQGVTHRIQSVALSLEKLSLEKLLVI
jgi:hypothetical protein